MRAQIRVHDATGPEISLVRWGVSRFEAAGLPLPPLDVYFHDTPSGCRGFPGYFEGDRIDLCPGAKLNLVPRDDLAGFLLSSKRIRRA